MSKRLNNLLGCIFSARWITLINIGLSAILGYNIVQLGLSFNMVSIAPGHSPLSKRVADKLTLPTETLLDTTPLLQAYLFGESAPALSQATSQTAPPETRLNLSLQGIYYSSNPTNSFAMITQNNGKSVHYRIGKSLGNGLILQEIHPKYVILNRSGQHEMLRLTNVKSADAPKISSPKTTSVASPITLPEASTSIPAKPEKLLGHYQQQLVSNPESLLDLLKVDPVTNKEGNFMGYRIGPGKDATVLAQFRLQAGDVVTAVNGITLDSPLKGLGLVQQLALANQVTLQVVRNGQPLFLSFNVEK